MLFWILTFFVLAVVCAALGFGGLASTFSWLAQLFALVFAVLFVVSLISGGVRRSLAGEVP
ncbi:MAG: DUF1328 family protein [Myxococcota bacterium]